MQIHIHSRKTMVGVYHAKPTRILWYRCYLH